MSAYDEFTGGMEDAEYDEFTGGWIPKDYLTDLPIEVYENKRGKKYYNIAKFFDTHKDLDAPEKKDEAMKRIYLSAKMMKWHLLITKDLKKNYSLLASAALREMSPDMKFLVKKWFNRANGAIKELRKRTKEQRAPYGPINKRNIARKAAFWNQLIDLNLDDEEDVAKIPALLNGYYPGMFAKPELGYKPNGLIGAAPNYQAYKDAMEKIRNDRKTKRELLSEKEKMLIRARMKLWNAGKKAVRERLKAVKEQLECEQLKLGMDRFNTDILGDYYTKAWAAERARAPDFYKGVTDQELIDELIHPSGKSLFQKGWEAANANGKRTKDNIPAPDVWHGVDLTTRGPMPELQSGPFLLTNGEENDVTPGDAYTGESQQTQPPPSQPTQTASTGPARRKRKSAEERAAEEAAKIYGRTPVDDETANGWGWGWY